MGTPAVLDEQISLENGAAGTMRAGSHQESLKYAQSVHLDAVRGLAALIVVLHHSGKFTLLPRESVSIHLSAAVVAFYWISSFANAHNAVLVFFVLSGYLVGGSVLRSLEKRRGGQLAKSEAGCAILVQYKGRAVSTDNTGLADLALS